MGAPSGRRPLPTPWPDPMERADRLILGWMVFAGVYNLLLLPLFPLLGSSHPALLEFVRGSPAAIVNMGARASTGETSLVAAVLLGVPSVMMFDWVFWWAGRRWGDRVFLYLLGGDTPRAHRRLGRVHWLERRFGGFAVVLADILPLPAALVYAAVGDGGMRLRTFLALDLIGTLLWTGSLSLLGYQLGHDAVDVVDAIGRYSLWFTLGLIVVVFVVSALRARRDAPARP